MKTSHTFGVQFIIRTTRNEKDIGKVYARITVDRTRVEISLKKSIHSDYWNKGKGCAKGSNPESRLLNTYLNQVQGKLTDCYRELQLNEEIVTANAVKQLFFGDNLDQHSLKELIDYHDYSQFPKMAEGTIRNYGVTRRYIFSFLEKKRGISDIYLTKVDYKFITDFDFFLRTVKPKDHNQPIGNNGLMKHMQRFRKILNLGVRLDWVQKNPFDAYDLSCDELISVLIAAEYDDRTNRRITRSIKNAHFRYSASIEELHFDVNRNLDRTLMSRLASCKFITKAENILISGSTGVGKSFIASAFGNQA